MNCDVVRLIALDEILGLFFGAVVIVTFEFYIGNDFLHDGTANSTCFRVPCDMIAALERLGHLFSSIATERKMHPAKQYSGEKRCQPCLRHHEEYHVLALASGQPRALPTARLC